MADWDDLRFFLAVARDGSLSSAARTLGVAQPTVGRRIGALERLLDAKLFVQTAGGQALTPTGRRMLAHAENMELDALSAFRIAAGRGAGLRGRVTVTAAEWMVDRVLTPILARLLPTSPELEVELLADVKHLSLARREADIAIRPSRFEHPDVIQREVAVVAFALYASDAYVSARGVPDFAGGCPGHALIAMSESLGKVPDVDWLPAVAAHARVVARCNGRLPMATLAQAGVGLACLPRFLGDALGLRALPAPSPPTRKLWLGVHRDARAVPRIKLTSAFLADGIGRLRPALNPNPA